MSRKQIAFSLYTTYMATTQYKNLFPEVMKFKIYVDASLAIITVQSHLPQRPPLFSGLLP